MRLNEIKTGGFEIKKQSGAAQTGIHYIVTLDGREIGSIQTEYADSGKRDGYSAKFDPKYSPEKGDGGLYRAFFSRRMPELLQKVKDHLAKLQGDR